MPKNDAPIKLIRRYEPDPEACIKALLYILDLAKKKQEQRTNA